MSSPAEATAASDKSGAPAAAPQVGNQVLNVPNALSMARLILAIAVGVLIEYQWFTSAWIIFIVAASTDFVDGWWARRFNQMTKLGRILDPFVDKIIITAAMVALVGVPSSGVAAWMVTVIIGRELLVTSLRGMVEGRGGDFSARWLGMENVVPMRSGRGLFDLGQPVGATALVMVDRARLVVARRRHDHRLRR